MTPQGRTLDRALVAELAVEPRLLLVCGRYEGIDERVREHLVDLEVSVGDFVLSGGELQAMLLLDAVARFVPGVLGSEGSLEEESFGGWAPRISPVHAPGRVPRLACPDVLLSGNHAEIARWRRRQRLLLTLARHPDLLDAAEVTPAERRWLAEQAAEAARAPDSGGLDVIGVGGLD